MTLRLASFLGTLPSPSQMKETSQLHRFHGFSAVKSHHRQQGDVKRSCLEANSREARRRLLFLVLVRVVVGKLAVEAIEPLTFA